MRKEYELTEDELNELLNASKPTPVMYLSGGQSMCGSPQENANRAWEKLGNARGFDYMTVQPSSRGKRFFTAEERKP